MHIYSAKWVCTTRVYGNLFQAQVTSTTWFISAWLLCLICLPGVSWWWSGSSSRCHGIVCGLWLWYFLIILTIFSPIAKVHFVWKGIKIIREMSEKHVSNGIRGWQSKMTKWSIFNDVQCQWLCAGLLQKSHLDAWAKNCTILNKC